MFLYHFRREQLRTIEFSIWLVKPKWVTRSKIIVSHVYISLVVVNFFFFLFLIKGQSFLVYHPTSSPSTLQVVMFFFPPAISISHFCLLFDEQKKYNNITDMSLVMFEWDICYPAVKWLYIRGKELLKLWITMWHKDRTTDRQTGRQIASYPEPGKISCSC